MLREDEFNEGKKDAAADYKNKRSRDLNKHTWSYVQGYNEFRPSFMKKRR